MTPLLDHRRILLYILIAFGFSWAISALIFATGGLANSPEMAPGIPLALLLLILIMAGPSIGHIVTRLLTREGWSDLWLRPKLRHGWRFWLIVWLGTPLLIAAGGALYFALFPQHFDPTLGRLAEQLAAVEAQTGQPLPMSPQTLLVVQIIQGILIAPLINLVPILGEEFGWRAYLLPKLLPLGERRAYLASGIIWGLWHAPIIAMGHNYGVAYPGAPWTGILMMTWFCIVLGTFLGWATLRAGPVWPAVIGHALVNGLAAAAIYMSQGEPNPLLGPSVAGLIGSAPFALVAALIFLRGRAVAPAPHEALLAGGAS